MTETADLESSIGKHAITPGEVLPARELLGDMLLDLGRHEAALAAYTASLQRSPNRFNSLFGAGRALELAEDDEGAAEFYEQVVAIGGETNRSRLEHARRFVTEGS